MTAPPTEVQPAAGSIVITDYPEVVARAGYNPDGTTQTVKTQWQVASNTGFSADLQSVTTIDFSDSGQRVTMALPAPLSGGTWYIHARHSDQATVLSAWTTTAAFTITHHPFALAVLPGPDEKVRYATGTITFNWQFGDEDPRDLQGKYQVRAYNASDDTLIFDTGQITSVEEEHSQAISATYDNAYVYWQVKVWDTQGFESNWSSAVLFQITRAPTIDITYPTNGGAVTTPNPIMHWSFTAAGDAPMTYADVEADFATYQDVVDDTTAYADLTTQEGVASNQVRFRLRCYQFPRPVPDTPDDPLTPPPAKQLIYDSDWVDTASTQHAIPTMLFHLEDNYSVRVDAEDINGFVGRREETFNAQWIGPDPPSNLLVDISKVDDPDVGAVQITWDADIFDPTFRGWTVYRRRLAKNTGRPIGSWRKLYTSDKTGGRAEYLDYFFASEQRYEYAVNQKATRYFGDVVEGTFGIFDVTPIATQYWMISRTNPDLNVMIPNVTSDDYSEVYEMDEQVIIGRGRRVEYGTRFGFAGSLSAQLRGHHGITAAQELDRIRQTKDLREEAYLRVPFGHFWMVALGDVSVTRLAGVGMNELVDITVPYSEVIEPS